MRFLASLLVALLLLGCGNESRPAEQASEPERTPPVQTAPPPTEPSGRTTPLESLPTVTLSVKDKKMRLWVASSEETRREGLMFVTKDQMGENRGMIFVFPDLDYRGFWMKNTIIPLDIAYLRSDGVIINILTMSPLDESTYRSEEPAQYAIEMHAGWFDQNGIRPGDRVDLSPLARLNLE